MIGGNGIVQDYQSIPFLCCMKPLQPPFAVLCKFEQKLPFMASVGDVPYLARDVMSFCSCHGYIAVFGPEKCEIGPFLTVKLFKFLMLAVT